MDLSRRSLLLSISDGLPVSIQAVLEGIDRGGVDDMLRKTVPRTDYPLTVTILAKLYNITVCTVA